MSTAAMVALYARVSSEQQSKRGTIDSQIAALKERISADGAQIVEDMCFIDAGVSGATLIRPQLERLRDCAALGAIDQLYILSPDRLARKYAHQALLMEEFSACGVQVVFLNHAIGTTPEESLLLQMPEHRGSGTPPYRIGYCDGVGQAILGPQRSVGDIA
jgi:site-specific DNA recombinase